MLRGNGVLNGQSVSTGDGAAVSEETELTIQALEPSEIMLFDLA